MKESGAIILSLPMETLIWRILQGGMGRSIVMAVKRSPAHSTRYQRKMEERT